MKLRTDVAESLAMRSGRLNPAHHCHDYGLGLVMSDGGERQYMAFRSHVERVPSRGDQPLSSDAVRG